MDTLGFEPKAFRIRSGCATTPPCALATTAPVSITLHMVCKNDLSRRLCVIAMGTTNYTATKAAMIVTTIAMPAEMTHDWHDAF